MATFYHVTSNDSAQKILQEGANPEFQGTNAGRQNGAGFSVCSNLTDLTYWANKLFNSEPAIIAVNGDTLRIMPHGQVKSYFTNEGKDFVMLMVTRGYATLSQPGEHYYYPTDKAYALHGVTLEMCKENFMLEIGIELSVLGAIIADLGYDGYDLEEETVITNWQKLTPDKFSLYKA